MFSQNLINSLAALPLGERTTNKIREVLTSEIAYTFGDCSVDVGVQIRDPNNPTQSPIDNMKGPVIKTAGSPVIICTTVTVDGNSKLGLIMPYYGVAVNLVNTLRLQSAEGGTIGDIVSALLGYDDYVVCSWLGTTIGCEAYNIAIGSYNSTHYPAVAHDEHCRNIDLHLASSDVNDHFSVGNMSVTTYPYTMFAASKQAGGQQTQTGDFLSYNVTISFIAYVYKGGSSPVDGGYYIPMSCYLTDMQNMQTLTEGTVQYITSIPDLDSLYLRN